MSIFKIEKNVPVPSATRASGRGIPKYPWADLKVGDSFVVPGDGLDPRRIQTNVSSCGNHYGHRHPGFKVKTAIEGQNVRIWRIA